MEGTQRLECTQNEFHTSSERTCPVQVGFLGICGAKYPINKGFNKIGRDPQTCSIILNDNTISRQHAMINILNKKDFMLMDFDSSNKTKLQNKTLQPYLPHPLKNGDTVQFGQVFGIFRLLEDDDDLPMTQAVEIPDTPVNARHLSRLKIAPVTTVPESPDVSDRDDSFFAQSPKNKTDFKSPNKFAKTSIKGIQQIGSNKIDNAYWSTSKKSDSFNSNYDNTSTYIHNKSSISPKNLTTEQNIYDMETQAPAFQGATLDSIYEAKTQVIDNHLSPTIYNCETQVPNIKKLPEVFKVTDQSNVRLNLYSTKERFDIYEADTQITLPNKEKKTLKLSRSKDTTDQECDTITNINKQLNNSDEEICFKDIDCLQDEDICGSQPLLPMDTCDLNVEENAKSAGKGKVVYTLNKNGTGLLRDSDSKHGEIISPHQQVTATAIDDDVTDCEDNILELPMTNSNQPKNPLDEDDITDCEDDVIEVSQNRSRASNLLQEFHDLPTQLIQEENDNRESNNDPRENSVPFDEMLTQVIEECPIENNDNIVKNTNESIPFEDLQTQMIDISVLQEQTRSPSEPIENTNNFKRPFSSSIVKKKDNTLSKNSKSAVIVVKQSNTEGDEDDQNFYNATQEILNDLCTQNEKNDLSPGLSINSNKLIRATSSGDSEATERNDNFLSNLSKEQIGDVIGVNLCTTPTKKKISSDSSDLEMTPKKFNPRSFLMIDLPNSQDIKSCNFVSSDGFEDIEEQNENQNSPQIDINKKRRKKDIKLDLMKNPPTRIITRTRKLTSKISDSDSATKKMSEKILKSCVDLQNNHEIVKKTKSKMNNNNCIKSERVVTDVISKRVEKEQNLQEYSKQGTKEHINPRRSKRELKQQNIKSMFKVPNSNDCIPVESDKNISKSRCKSKQESKQTTQTEIKELDSGSCKQKKSNTKYHSSRNVKETINLCNDKEKEVRRSKRHHTAKDNFEDKIGKLQKNDKYKIPKKSCTVTSESNEHSAVYNLSSEAGVDSPRHSKRRATSDILPLKTKKAKSSSAQSVRETPLRGIRTQYVLFTAFPSEEIKRKLEILGAVTVSDVKKCTVVLTLQIKRTFKLLCAMGLGKPIVGPNWVQACVDSNMIVDPWLYLLKDEATEKRFGFNLRQSLTCKRNFLKGYNISATPNVLPSSDEMKSIVECSGGTWKEGGANWFCVSSPSDKALWSGLRKRGATLVSKEFILGGVLQQRVNLHRDRIE